MPETDAPWAEIDRLLDEAAGYEGTANAALEAVMKTFSYAASRCGLTGFQAGWVMLHAYARTMGVDGPLAVFKGQDLLYPQYDLPRRLERWMAECEPWLAEQAQKKLDEDRGYAVEAVRSHWRRLAGRLRVVPS